MGKDLELSVSTVGNNVNELMADIQQLNAGEDIAPESIFNSAKEVMDELNYLLEQDKTLDDKVCLKLGRHKFSLEQEINKIQTTYGITLSNVKNNPPEISLEIKVPKSELTSMSEQYTIQENANTLECSHCGKDIKISDNKADFRACPHCNAPLQRAIQCKSCNGIIPYVGEMPIICPFCKDGFFTCNNCGMAFDPNKEKCSHCGAEVKDEDRTKEEISVQLVNDNENISNQHPILELRELASELNTIDSKLKAAVKANDKELAKDLFLELYSLDTLFRDKLNSIDPLTEPLSVSEELVKYMLMQVQYEEFFKSIAKDNNKESEEQE